MVSIHLKKKQQGAYPYKVMEKPPAVLRAIIFDCDGVLIDSEPLHYVSFKKALGKPGESLNEEIYTEKYVALDDKGAISKFYQENKIPLKITDLDDLMKKKTEIYQDMVKSGGVLAFPAVPEFVMAMSQQYPLAVASGSRKHELELVLEAAGIRAYFEAVISADDVKKGKPDPESFLKAVEALNASGKRNSRISPEECLVIEDSKEGIKSAHAAKMKCLAVSTTHPPFELSHADLVVPSLSALRNSQIADLFLEPQPQPKTLPSPQSN